MNGTSVKTSLLGLRISNVASAHSLNTTFTLTSRMLFTYLAFIAVCELVMFIVYKNKKVNA
ncbi:hypothetical protein [uncultured Lactobacillus sp.]|uniref:hypothetical protein n=1 Tax=uncultured Lactobacillus sp. TaxID=153152 RepID=UPI00260442C9|nr:hypothetical protein [uncultured Lactobacillus sp.]